MGKTSTTKRRQREAFLKSYGIDERTQQTIIKAVAEFSGDSSILQSAIGGLIFAQMFGWQGLRVTMSSTTFAKYERILGVRFRDICPERTTLSTEIAGIRIVDGFGKFWQALSGGVVKATEGKMIEPA